ncbi:MAG TPA: sulfatase-like hydrolase/transferase [Vicinamibacterales bacterium]|nr:sulfatase-like hydrolase/transferase [Vicinamibacterales bacterium]
MIRTLQRLAVAVFCWVTALYAFLSSSAFAYQQFIRPRVFRSIGWFGDWHGRLYWIWLALALLPLAADVRERRIGRRAAAAFALTWGAVGLWLLFRPVLPGLVDDRRSLVVGMIALLPLMWLSGLDHRAVAGWLRNQPRTAPADTDAQTETRLLAAAMGTALAVPILYAALTPLALAGAFEPDLLTRGLFVGLSWNVAHHLVAGGLAFLVMALVHHATARAPFAVRYAAVLALAAAALALVSQSLFGAAIGLDGAWGAAVSIVLAASIVATWTGLQIRSFAREGAVLASGFDLLFGPVPVRSRGWRDGAALAVIAAAAFGLAAFAARLDWDFLIARLSVIAIWIAVFDRFYGASRPVRSLPRAAVVAACLLPLVLRAASGPVERRLPAWLHANGFSVRHTLDRYVVYNPSFRLADALFPRGPAAEPALNAYLRANTGVPASASHPVDVDFVAPPLEPARGPRPWIFLFVIDSLRADYLGAYNAGVAFTPRIDAFARESVTFRHAFTRYGGTGLSMPAIWSGSAGVHTQYLQPFHPMNALEKLLDANAYPRHIALDHIMADLLEPSPSVHELDRGVPEMSFDFCRTLDEVRARVAADPAPAFVHSRSLNLHVAAIRGSAAPDAEAYPGFEARYASRVHRMDGCFGRFVDFLKASGLYDRSIVVLTADHGEELGADGRWGHAYYLFPGVLQVPLIVHLPAGARAAADPDAVAFTTDITPTLYVLLGYDPVRRTPLMGEPLVGRPGARSAARRREDQVVIASYGAVYGALSRNGSRLYIVDANHQAEYAYRRAGERWQAVPVTAAIRFSGRRAIREYVEEIAREYQVEARRP